VLADNQLIIDEKLTMPHLKTDPRAVSILEKKLLDIIVKYNYYRDIQMDTLFGACRKANSMLDANVVNEAIENVKRIMDE
jgi:hypothetical protein